MEIVLAMMLGFMALAARSKEGKRADIGLVELLLAGVFLMFIFGQSAG